MRDTQPSRLLLTELIHKTVAHDAHPQVKQLVISIVTAYRDKLNPSFLGWFLLVGGQTLYTSEAEVLRQPLFKQSD